MKLGLKVTRFISSEEGVWLRKEKPSRAEATCEIKEEGSSGGFVS